MKKMIATFFTAYLLSLPAFAQPGLEKITLPDNKLEMLVPKGFSRVTDALLSVEYPEAGYKPSWAIAGEESNVSLAYSNTNESVDDNAIPGFTDKLIKEQKVNRKDFKLVDDGILLVDGKNIGYIKFMSRVKDEKIFHFMFYISVAERLVLFSFDCPKRLRKKWESKAEEMAGSLRLLP
jgi:hypothetical protein